jgi:hypothetical protein
VPFTIRLDLSAKAALDREAARQARPPANLAQALILEALKEKGLLK